MKPIDKLKINPCENIEETSETFRSHGWQETLKYYKCKFVEGAFGEPCTVIDAATCPKLKEGLWTTRKRH